MNRQAILFILILLLRGTSLSGENKIVQLTLADSKNLFLQNNLSLLAARYDIELAEAEKLQAKLFENPIITLEHNVYNRNNKRYFDFGKESESGVEIEQIIYLAGQRNKRVKLEKINVEIAHYQFEEVLRTLHGELNEKFIEIYFLSKSAHLYHTQLEALDALLKVTREQEKQGNISRMEKKRLDALYLSLRKESIELENDLLTLTGEFKLLLNIPAEYSLELVLEEDILHKKDLSILSYDELKLRLRERPDLKIASTEIKASEANLKLQRSLAAPEFSLKGMYDRVGNFYDNYFAIGLGLSIPIFNRNQGGIKAAKLDIRKNRLYETQEIEKAQMELFVALQHLQKNYQIYKMSDEEQEQEFEILMKGINENYEKRNISMLEFIDYYDSYKEMWLQVYDTKKEVFTAIETLNNTVGQIIIEY